MKSGILGMPAAMLVLCVIAYGVEARAQQSSSVHGQELKVHANSTKAQLNVGLEVAIQDRDSDRVADLLRQGADPNATNKSDSMLDLAVKSCYTSGSGMDHSGAALEVARVLLKAGAKPDNTALALATVLENVPMCELLLKYHASVDFADPEGVTPLMHAVECGNLPLVDLLLAHRANPNACTETGMSPLAISIVGSTRRPSSLMSPAPVVSASKLRLFQKLIASGDVKAKTQEGDSLLALAVGVGNLVAARLLLAKGADINEPGGSGCTPLLYAALKDQNETMRFLLANRANPNLAGPDGTTPLMAEVFHGNVALVQMLLAKGANPSAQRPDGQTALKIARHAKPTALVNLLAAADAKE